MIDTAPKLPEPDPEDVRLDELPELTKEDWVNAGTGHRSLRCTGLKADGVRCGNPAMNSSTERLCRWHVRDREDGIVDEGGRKIRLGAGSDLPEELVRSLRSVLGTDAEPVISAFTDSLKSTDDKLATKTADLGLRASGGQVWRGGRGERYSRPMRLLGIPGAAALRADDVSPWSPSTIRAGEPSALRRYGNHAATVTGAMVWRAPLSSPPVGIAVAAGTGSVSRRFSCHASLSSASSISLGDGHQRRFGMFDSHTEEVSSRAFNLSAGCERCSTRLSSRPTVFRYGLHDTEREPT